MTTQSMLDDLTETDRISDLLDELVPLGVPEMPTFPAAAPPAAGASRRRPVGSLPLTAFLGGVNWANDAAFRSPFHGELAGEESDLPQEWDRRPLPVGAIPLRAFLARVNWDNAADAPELPTFTAIGCPRPEARVTVENFLAGFSWD